MKNTADHVNAIVLDKQHGK